MKRPSRGEPSADSDSVDWLSLLTLLALIVLLSLSPLLLDLYTALRSR